MGGSYGETWSWGALRGRDGGGCRRRGCGVLPAPVGGTADCEYRDRAGVCGFLPEISEALEGGVLVRGDEGPAPLLGEVFELGVLGSDEVQLLFAASALQLLLTGDGLGDAFVALVVEETGAVVPL